MTILRKLWNDEVGFVVSTELILVATILVIGVIAGLQTLRVAVVTELADVASSVGSVSQSYQYSGVAGHHAGTNGSIWADERDTCDAVGATTMTSNCISVCGVGGSTVPSSEDQTVQPASP